MMSKKMGNGFLGDEWKLYMVVKKIKGRQMGQVTEIGEEKQRH